MKHRYNKRACNTAAACIPADGFLGNWFSFGFWVWFEKERFMHFFSPATDFPVRNEKSTTFNIGWTGNVFRKGNQGLNNLLLKPLQGRIIGHMRHYAIASPEIASPWPYILYTKNYQRIFAKSRTFRDFASISKIICRPARSFVPSQPPNNNQLTEKPAK